MMQIGKAGIDNPVEAPMSMTVAADEISLVAAIGGRELTDAEYWALIYQCAGYPNADEPIAPVVLTNAPAAATEFDTYLSGMFEIISVDVTRSHPDELSHVAELSLTVRRPPGWACPQQEVLVQADLLSNTISYGTGFKTPWWAIPGDAFDIAGPPAGGTWTTRATEDGTVLFWYDTNLTGQIEFLGTYSVAPADHYQGGCGIEQQAAGGSDWLQVCGLQCENEPTKTRITNKRVRVTLTTAGFEVQWWDGSAWTTAKEFELTAGSTESAWNTVTVLHSSPERITICASKSQTSGGERGRIFAWFTLLRGATTLIVSVKSDIASNWRIGRTTNEAAAAIPTGVSSGCIADAGTNRFMLMTPSDATADTTVGALALDVAAGECVFGVSMDLNYAASADPDEYDSLQAQFFAVIGQVLRIVGR